jgi:UDP-glucuronate decarboxylase
MSLKILVTGGAGFIGSNLCKKLLNSGHHVCCLDNFFSGSKSNISNLLLKHSSTFTLIEADVIEYNYNNLPFIPDQIYHLACPASPKFYQKDPIYTAKISFIGTLRLLDYIRLTGNPTRILFTSTSEVYGDPLEHPQKETYRGNTSCTGIRGCYDEGKRIAETLMFDSNRMYGTDIRVARIFNTYGDNLAPDDGRVISNFICQALSNNPLTIYGDGLQTRSCCYVSDMVTALISLMNQTLTIGPVNLGNPEEITIKNLAEKILELIPESKSEIVYKSLPSDDPKIRCPDITLASSFWKPSIGLEEGLKLSIEYFKNNK